MSDYTNTFGGAAKDAANDTILAAQHDTQYDALAVHIATKSNKIASATTGNLIEQDGNGDLVDSGVATSDVVVDGDISGFRTLTILDTPESLGTATTEDSWVTINSSTLASAGATTAILRFSVITLTTTGTSADVYVYIRKTGSGVSHSNSTLVVRSSNSTSSSSTYVSGAAGECHVNLDTSQDFDYRLSVLGAATSGFQVTLVGYYA